MSSATVSDVTSTRASKTPVGPDLWGANTIVLGTAAFFSFAARPSEPILGERLVTISLMVLTMLVIRSATAHLFNSRAGLVASAMFGFTGPVLDTGNTRDTVVLLLLATSMWLLVRCRSDTWLILPAVLSACAAARLKMTVIGESDGAVPRLIAGDYLWPIGVAALVGLGFLIKKQRWSYVLLGLGSFILAVIPTFVLPGDTIYASHLAYSALFLAPLAGWGLARPWKLSIWSPILTLLLTITILWGAFRAHEMF